MSSRRMRSTSSTRRSTRSVIAKVPYDIMLRKWHFTLVWGMPSKLFADCTLLVLGTRVDTNVSWSTSEVVDVIPPYYVSTAGGRVYKVDGNIDLAYMYEKANFPANLARKFTEGFPSNWKSLMDKFVKALKSKIIEQNAKREREQNIRNERKRLASSNDSDGSAGHITGFNRSSNGRMPSPDSAKNQRTRALVRTGNSVLIKRRLSGNKAVLKRTTRSPRVIDPSSTTTSDSIQKNPRIATRSHSKSPANTSAPQLNRSDDSRLQKSSPVKRVQPLLTRSLRQRRIAPASVIQFEPQNTKRVVLKSSVRTASHLQTSASANKPISTPTKRKSNVASPLKPMKRPTPKGNKGDQEENAKPRKKVWKREFAMKLQFGLDQLNPRTESQWMNIAALLDDKFTWEECKERAEKVLGWTPSQHGKDQEDVTIEQVIEKEEALGRPGTIRHEKNRSELDEMFALFWAQVRKKKEQETDGDDAESVDILKMVADLRPVETNSYAKATTRRCYMPIPVGTFSESAYIERKRRLDDEFTIRDWSRFKRARLARQAEDKGRPRPPRCAPSKIRPTTTSAEPRPKKEEDELSDWD